MAEDWTVQTWQTAAKLHTAGQNTPDCAIRLPVPSRSKESDADLSWVERVNGSGYGEPNRDGP